MSTGLTSQDLSNINVSVNEYISRHSINRNIQKLLHNDLQLDAIYTRILSQLNIAPYSERSTKSFDYNQLVWYRDANDFSQLYLLKSIIDNNSYSPQLAIDQKTSYGSIDFERYGWSDQNAYLDVITENIRQSIQRYIKDQIRIHTSSTQYHKFGEISTDPASPDYYENKLMLRDVSNAHYPRESVFYPFQTGYFTTDSVIYGTYNIWDNGILEFDLVFRVGWTKANNPNSTSLYTTLECNTVSIPVSTVEKGEEGYQENAKYFNTTSDMTIFSQPGQGTFKTNDLIQTKRNDYVNTYAAEIEFPEIVYDDQVVQGFTDLNYMVFNGTSFVQDRNGSARTISPSQNAMTFCNKTTKAITALLVVFEDPANYSVPGKNAESNGLIANSFSCHIVGKWK